MENNKTLAAGQKSLLVQIIPVMLCFFAMGFVDLVGTASNYVQKDLSLTDSQSTTSSRHSSSSGSSSSQCLQDC